MRSTRLFARPEFSSGSLADMAFLMLTFFMITTQIHNEKGLAIVLPKFSHVPPVPVHDRNMFTIHINSADRYMVNGSIRTGLHGLREEIKRFILNYGQDPDSSVDPEKAVISLKTDRGASHRAYILALDEIQAAYYELYAERAGMEVETFRRLDINNPSERALYEKGKKGLPMNISIAESGQ